MQGTQNDKRKIIQWREKAKERRIEKESYKRRIQELIKSRDNWKSKYKRTQVENRRLKKAKVVEKEPLLEDEKPKHHSYCVRTILLFIWLRQQGNVSLRSCVSMLKILKLVLHLKFEIPSKSSLQNWEKKLGYHRLNKSGDSSAKWAIILDLSLIHI